MKKFLLSCLVICCAMSSLASAEDKAAAMPSKEEEAKMMEKWTAYMTPGKEHEMMGKQVGNWNAETTMWMAKDAPAQKSKGTCKGEMLLGGRYLWTTEKGDMMGMPFEGHALICYDNNKKKYMMSWADNMGTGLLNMEGTASSDGKTITYMGKMDDCMSGEKDKPLKMVTTWMDDTHRKFEMWDAPGTPNEFKIIESVYTKDLQSSR